LICPEKRIAGKYLSGCCGKTMTVKGKTSRVKQPNLGLEMNSVILVITYKKFVWNLQV